MFQKFFLIYLNFYQIYKFDLNLLRALIDVDEEVLHFDIPMYYIRVVAKMDGVEVSNRSVSTGIKFSSRLRPKSAIGPSFIVKP